MSTGPAPGYHTSEDEQILHKLGLRAGALPRDGRVPATSRSAFTIISILAGCLTSYVDRVRARRPGGRDVGLAPRRADERRSSRLSMAEIASAYPTAGGLYYWASKLGSPGWGWATGWFNLIGQIAVTAAIGYGLAIVRARCSSTTGSTTRTHMDDWFGASSTCRSYVLYVALPARACSSTCSTSGSRRC